MSIIYIDTSSGMFKAPDGVESYSTWLHAAYNASATRYSDQMVYRGVGQRINAIIYAVNHQCVRVIAHGPDAQEAAAVIKNLSGNTVTAEVVKE